MSISELDVPGPVSPRRRMPHRGWRLGAAVAAVLAMALAIWTVVGIHVDGPLDFQHAGHATACVPSPLREPGDITLALGVGPELPFRLQDVRVIGAQNLTLRGAYIGVVNPGADGSYTLPPAAAGWPSLANGISPSSLIPAANAVVAGSSPRALVLRLHIDQPTTNAGFQDIGLMYRSGLIHHEKRLQYTLQVAAGAC